MKLYSKINFRKRLWASILDMMLTIISIFVSPICWLLFGIANWNEGTTVGGLTLLFVIIFMVSSPFVAFLFIRTYKIGKTIIGFLLSKEGWIYLMLMFIPLGYFFAKDGFNNGQSYGKKYTGLMVIDIAKSEPCTRSKSAFRQLILLLLCIPYGEGLIIETLVSMIQNEGRRLGDFAAKTQVVYLEEYQKFSLNN